MINNFENLYADYENRKISLQHFQFSLESMLGSFVDLSTTDEEFIKATINKIELIIYTVPENTQKTQIAKIIPQVREYLKTKII